MTPGSLSNIRSCFSNSERRSTIVFPTALPRGLRNVLRKSTAAFASSEVPAASERAPSCQRTNSRMFVTNAWKFLPVSGDAFHARARKSPRASDSNSATDFSLNESSETSSSSRSSSAQRSPVRTDSTSARLRSCAANLAASALYCSRTASMSSSENELNILFAMPTTDSSSADCPSASTARTVMLTASFAWAVVSSLPSFCSAPNLMSRRSPSTRSSNTGGRSSWNSPKPATVGVTSSVLNTSSRFSSAVSTASSASVGSASASAAAAAVSASTRAGGVDCASADAPPSSEARSAALKRLSSRIWSAYFA